MLFCEGEGGFRDGGVVQEKWGAGEAGGWSWRYGETDFVVGFDVELDFFAGEGADSGWLELVVVGKVMGKGKGT